MLNESQVRGLKNGDVVYHDQFQKDRTVDRVEFDNGKKKWVAVSLNGSRMTGDHLTLVSKAEECVKDCNDKECVKESKVNNMKTGLSGRVNEAMCMVKADGTDALWRTSAKQAVKTAKVPVVAFLGKTKFGGVVAPMAAEFLDTAAGEAALSWVAGNVMAQVPSLNCDPKLRRLAKEMRVMGLEWVSDQLGDLVFSPFRDGLKELVSGLAVDTPEV